MGVGEWTFCMNCETCASISAKRSEGIASRNGLPWPAFEIDAGLVRPAFEIADDLPPRPPPPDEDFVLRGGIDRTRLLKRAKRGRARGVL